MIPRSLLIAQLERYAGWTYAPDGPDGVRHVTYPSPLPGMPGLTAPPPTVTDCCSFVEGLIIGPAGAAGHGEWGRAFHNRMMILDEKRDRFGPVDVLVDVGLAERLKPSDEVWPTPAVAQGWGPSGGHTFLLWERSGDAYLRLECSKSQGGVVWRDVGRVISATPPDDWAKRARPWSTARIRRWYPELAICALRVVDDVEQLAALGSPVAGGRGPEGGGSIRA